MSFWVEYVVLVQRTEAVQFNSIPEIVDSFGFAIIQRTFTKVFRVMLISPFICFPKKAVFICCESGPSKEMPEKCSSEDCKVMLWILLFIV